MAYANLPERLKRRIAGLTARHGHDYSINRGDVRAKGSTGAEGPRWVHPVVRNHPQTGEPLLFVSRLITEEIIGLPPAEGDELLEELLTYIEDPKVIYRHKWRVGDYIAWDNLALQHARTNFDPAEKRVLRRVPISGRDVAVAPVSH